MYEDPDAPPDTTFWQGISMLATVFGGILLIAWFLFPIEWFYVTVACVAVAVLLTFLTEGV